MRKIFIPQHYQKHLKQSKHKAQYQANTQNTTITTPTKSQTIQIKQSTYRTTQNNKQTNSHNNKQQQNNNIQRTNKINKQQNTYNTTTLRKTKATAKQSNTKHIAQA